MCNSVHRGSAGGGGGSASRGDLHQEGGLPPGGVCHHADPHPSDTMGYGQRAGGMHPTGMHSCSYCDCYLLCHESAH